MLEHNGMLDPEEIEDYIAVRRLHDLLNTLTQMTPNRSGPRHSGLRGRGGAGYPTGLKWSTVAKAAGNIST